MERDRDTYFEKTLDIVGNRIYWKFQNWCLALGWSRAEIRSWSEEMSGEGLCRVMKGCADWEKFGESKFHAYCVTEASTVARDELLKENSRVRAEASYVAEAAVSPQTHDPTQWLLESMELKVLLSELTEIQRETLAFYCICHMSVREIARIQGIPDKTVYTNLRRARLKLAGLAEKQSLKPPAHLKLVDMSSYSGPPTTRPPPPMNSRHQSRDLSV